MSTFNLGSIIDGKFEVIDEHIGRGGFGQVLEVKDLTTKKNVVLKYCLSENVEDIKRFKREVKTMSKIKHSNLIEIIDSNTEYIPPYFTMPKAVESLADKIESFYKNNLNATINAFEQICAGITIIHSSGHTHRDIKPQNALLFEDGRIVVSDLGLIKKNDRDTTIVTRTLIGIGTEGYMPPEALNPGGTRDMDHRSDIYMLGKTLYVLFTNANPILINTQLVPQGLLMIIQKATRFNPDERYQTVGEMVDALHDFERAIAPDNDPKLLFESLLDTANENLKSNEYDEQNVNEMMMCLSTVDTPEEYVEMIHNIPERLYSVLVTDFKVELEPLMDKYYNSIKECISDQPFSFADKVSRIMTYLIRNTTSPSIKQNSLKSLLVAAVYLNRFAAMDRFDQLLIEITDESDAFAVAEGLRDEITNYAKMYKRVPLNSLHPAIRVVWEKCSK